MNKSAFCKGGPRVSALAAGCWRMHEWGRDLADRRNWIDACLDLGIDCFDHADIYGDMRCETLFGDVLRESTARRARMTLVSKCGIRLPGTTPDAAIPALDHKVYDTSPEHILRSVDRSLANLGTDHLDVLLLHRPDPLMDPDAVAEAFVRLHAQGKVLHFGLSNHSASTVDLLAQRLPMPLVTHQIELSAWQHAPLRDAVIDQCLALRMRPMAWSPLGSGRVNEPSPVRDALARVGAELGCSIETTAVAWLLRHPCRPIPIVGTGRPDRLRQLALAADLRLEAAQWFRIYEAGLPGGLP
ncbi:MAG: aldo/keto reductase [Betaproteobacteria bacterium]|nr:aldo/keto reductase [Betaproteobacteria bacterium]